MRVCVDEPRRNDVAGGINGLRARQRFLGDANNEAVMDANIPDGVEPGFRIHDPTTQDDDVEVGGHHG